MGEGKCMKIVWAYKENARRVCGRNRYNIEVTIKCVWEKKNVHINEGIGGRNKGIR